MDVDGRFSGITGSVSDSITDLGDISVAAVLGWHHEKLHYSFGLPVFIPTGEYSLSTVDVQKRQVEMLNTSKNKFAIDLTLAMTYLDPESGLEVSGALGVTFNARNTDTNYRSGEELHVEAAVAQHLPNGMTLGLSGYAYQQLSDDSGSGARDLRRRLGARSLKARVFGVVQSSPTGRRSGISPSR